MKKRFAAILCCVLFAVGIFGVGCTSKGGGEVILDEINATVETWTAPEEFGRSQKYKVEVSGDNVSWREVEVYNVKNGHQLKEPLIAQAGATYFGVPYVAALVTFDFVGTVGVRVTYNGAKIEKDGYAISPASYKIKSKISDGTVTFTMTQNKESPRKVVFRPVNDWEGECLQIMTNVLEDEYKVDKTAANVYKIGDGEAIPTVLPEGKDVYYFEKGMHALPQGFWVDIDLGSVETIKSFDIMTPPLTEFTMPGGLCYEILAKETLDAPFVSVKKSVGKDAENNFNITGAALDATARYFRLVLLGNFTYTPVGNYRFFNSAFVKEFRLYNGSNTNVAAGKAVGGAGQNFAAVTDGVVGADYGHTSSGENFNLRSGYTYYLEKGAVLSGSFLGEGVQDVKILGRGILDSSILESENDLSEGRNGSIRIERSKDIVVEGITIMHAPMWMLVINHSENILVSGVNLFGYCTNSDGIHFSASKNAVATGCFIRTADDIFVAYHYGDADGLTFKNSVAWSDGGRILLLGLADAGDINDVTLENCDVITYQNVWSIAEHGGFVQILATSGKKISNVKIKDVRIDEVRFPLIAQFFQVRAGNDTFGAGHVDNVSFENVSFASKCLQRSLVSVMNVGGTVKNISFKNVSVEGDVFTKSKIGKYVNIDPEIDVTIL